MILVSEHGSDIGASLRSRIAKIKASAHSTPEWWNGIHAALKMLSPYGVVGSSPTLGTILRRGFGWLAMIIKT